MAVRHVIVYPINGYINRLQAIVSARLLAQDLGAQLTVCWEPGQAAPADATAIFSPQFIADSVKTAAEVEHEFGLVFRDIPAYFALDLSSGSVSIRGLDRGEQYFMPALRAAVADHPGITNIVLVAGGKFMLAGDAFLTPLQESEFRGRRAAAYGALHLSPEIERRAAGLRDQHMPYVAIHLRYSDRNHEAPSRRQIKRALAQLRMQSGQNALFIASDSRSALEYWLEMAPRFGFEPWVQDRVDLNRSDPRSAVGALIDWRILGGAEALVFFSESSFAEEAALATGSWESCIGLAVSASRSWWVRLSLMGNALVTYPRRHSWW